MSVLHPFTLAPYAGFAVPESGFGRRLIRRSSTLRMLALLLVGLVSPSAMLLAQTGGEAGIQGSVTDSTGAGVPNATITATDNATGVSTTRVTSGSGLYTISPIVPGTYTVTAAVSGFETFKQDNLRLDALKLTGLNITLHPGSAATEVTVTSAPPALESTNATLGGVLENDTYENLPLQMNGQQRDPTAFAVLLPGVQAGARSPIIGGTGNYLAEVYLDGLPVTTINQQGDNRTISNSIPVEAIDQFQVVTSIPSAEYQGAGLINFTLRSGANGYHGVLAAFVRNTIFDTWGFTAPALQCPNANGVLAQCKKPVEHQNELVASGGGPIPFTGHRGFFYATYDKFHGRFGINPNTLTVPTLKMRTGDFSELTVPIYDPTTTAACTSHSTTGVCRYQFGYAYGGTPGPAGNPALAGSRNVIPTGELSPIQLKASSYLPAPTNPGITLNYLGGVPSGYDNHEFSTRLDFDLSSRQRLSYVLTLGTRENVPFTVGGSPAGVVLPLPYTAGGTAIIKPTITDVEHNFQISDHMENQFKFGFARFSQPVGSLTYNVAPYRAVADLGISNLPAGQASDEFPGATFGATTAYAIPESPYTSNGASGANQTTVPNAYTMVDNFLLQKGKHDFTFGIEVQWLEDNVAGQLGPSGILSIPYSANSTAAFVPGTEGSTGNSLSTTDSGFAFASYLLGAASSSSVGIQAVAETGGRYRPVSPYIQDNWKITSKLTLNIGLRYDYLPPFHEVLDRWSFLNPNIPNPITGTKGALQFAGNRGDTISCNCRTPVQTWTKNIGPRIGFAYLVTPTTVLRGGYALVFSHGGGVGGRLGAGNGTGALGFNTNATAPAEQTAGLNAGPSYYLNNSAYFNSLGIANTAFGGPGFTLPSTTAPGAASATLSTGNYETAAGTYATPASISYADPYLSGRAPEFDFYSAGIQQAITDDLTFTLNYAGTQGHFLNTGSNARGYWNNQLSPAYLAALAGVTDSTGKTPLLNAAATPANMALLATNLPGASAPYAGFSAANATTSVGQALVAFPQYSGITDTWGQNVGNVSYNSLQLSLAMRGHRGNSFEVNYTWSKNMGDDGTFRYGYDLPASVTSNGIAYKQNRIDRSITGTDIPQNIAIFGVMQSPFGRNGLAADNRFVRLIAGGWMASGIFTYDTGTPLIVTYAGCTSLRTPNGQCEPDLNPAYTGNPRIGGKFGAGITAANLRAKSYIDATAFQPPNKFALPGTAVQTTAISKIGDVPRTAPYGLRNPIRVNGDLQVSRSFNLSPERFKAIFEVDCLNVANHPTFGNINTAYAPGSTTFGTVGSASGNRDFQLGGRFTF